MELDFNKLPENVMEGIVNGVYILKCEDIIKETSDEYGTKYVMSHSIENSSRKINYDNYKIFDAKGNSEAFGQGKLRAFIEATVDTPSALTKISVEVLKVLCVGKRFKAELEVNEKGYPNIKFANIYHIENPIEVLNDNPKEKAENKENITFENSMPSAAIQA